MSCTDRELNKYGLPSVVVIVKEDPVWKMNGPVGEWRFKTLEEREAEEMDSISERVRLIRERRQSDPYERLAKDMAQNGTGGVKLNREERRKLKRAEKRLGDRIWK